MTDAKKPWEQKYDDGSSGEGAMPWQQDYGPDADKAPSAPRGFKGWARDAAAWGVKSAISVPETAVGLADIVTGGRVGKALENEGGMVGFRPRQAREMVNEWHSDATKDAQRKFQEAEGVWGKTKAAIQNPSNIAGAVVESLGAMGAGGVAGRGLMALGGRQYAARAGQAAASRAAQSGASNAAQEAAKRTAQEAAMSRAFVGAAGAGEGLVAAGLQAENIRGETDDGLLTGKQAGLAAATAIPVGVFGVLGGAIAERFGLGNLGVMLTRGNQQAQQQVVGAIAGAGGEQAKQVAKSIPRRMIEGAIAEGFLEELPQELSEQILENLALDKPWSEDLDSAAVMGVLSGMVMGGAATGYRSVTERGAPQGAPEQGAPAEAPDAGGSQAAGETLALPAPVIDVSSGGVARTADDRNARLQRISSGDITDVTPIRETPWGGAEAEAAGPPTPSEQMGLRSGPDAGTMENAAALAVDSGVSPVAQAADADGVLQEAGQDAQGLSAWTDEELSSAFRGAQTKEVRQQLAQEMAARREQREQQALQDELDAEQRELNELQPPKDADEVFARTVEDAGETGFQARQEQGDGTQAQEAQQAGAGQPQAGAAQTNAGEGQASEAGAGGVQEGGVGVSPFETEQPKTTPKQQKALDRIAGGRAYFFSQPKAQAFIDDNGLSDTHELEQRGKSWHVVDSVKSEVARIDAAANEAATSPQSDRPEPTQAQKEAGNYAKGHIQVQGLDISIENPQGSERAGTDKDGKEWRHTMSHHYGYIKRTSGADGDQVDVYVGPNPASPQVFVVDQINQDNGRFDEHKVMLGFDNEADAVAAYRSNFDDGWKVGPVQAMSVDDFKGWLKDGDTTQPAAAAPEPAGQAYADAKARVDQATDRVQRASDAMRQFDGARNESGLTSDEVKSSPEWRAARAEMDAAHRELQDANKNAITSFPKEHKADAAKRQAEQRGKPRGILAKKAEAESAAAQAAGKSTEASGASAEGDRRAQTVTNEDMLQAAQESGKLVMAQVGDARPKKAAPEAQTQAKDADRFADNKLFTADKVAAARARMKAKLGTLNSGIDPEMLVDGMTIAGAYIESGVRNFTQYAQAMIEDLGDGVKPYLLSFWEGARNYPGLDARDMTDPAESARQHQALLAPTDTQTEAVGRVAEKPKQRARKTGARGDLVMTQDWGVEHIDGYGDAERETGNDTKDAFLKEARAYLNAVSDALRAHGYEPHAGRKGKPEKPVSVNESGVAGSGDVTLTMRNPENGNNVYIHIGDTALRGVVPTTDSGIAVMYRVGQGADRYASGAGNTWAPVDLSANELAQLVSSRAQPAQEARNEQSAIEDADQGGAQAVRGRGSAAQPGAAPADSGNVAPRQSQDDARADQPGDSGRHGVREPGTDVADVGRAESERPTADGRARTGRTRVPDAGARAAGTAGAADAARSGSSDAAKPVTSPAAAGVQAQDLHIENPLEIVGGTPVQRFNRNRQALELLQQLEEEGRQANPDEQRILAGYIGWGSFGQELFQGTWERPVYRDEGIWKERGEWLRETLGESAWKSAQRSITNAHFTDPPTIMSMWDMARRMGFKGGKVLEPSLGVGNFYSMMPADLKARSHLTGIELDETTGAIAKQLFPKSNIRIMGYEQSKTPDDFYDLVIGNWPFENTPIADRRYNKLNPMLHDYFFLKALDQVRPGGLVIGITSAGSMDKQNTMIRREMARKAELVASIRLPSGAFEEYAGTKVVTDIVILRKRAERSVAVPADATWVETGDFNTPSGETIRVNQYYLDNPSHVIGQLGHGSGTTTFRAGMIVHRPDDMAERLKQAVELVPENAMLPARQADHLTYYANETGERHGALAVVGDRLMVALGDQMVEANEKVKYQLKDAKKTAEREKQIRDAVGLRRLHTALVDAERSGQDAKDARKALKAGYDSFVKEHGGLRDSFALAYMKRLDDPFYYELAALENDDGTPATIMQRSTTRGRPSIKNPSIRDAYVLARNQSVSPSLKEIADIAGKTEDEVKADLLGSGAVFVSPSGDIVPSDIYLSGNVREKMRQAQAALAEGDAAMQSNIDALQEVMPEDVPYFNIETKLGATWVPNETYAQFIAHMLGRSDPKGIEVTFRSGRWRVKLDSKLNSLPEASANYGTPDYNFGRLVQAALSNQVLRLRSRDSDGNEYYDAKKSEEVNSRIAKMREDFATWLWGDIERRADLEREYNESRNAWATPRYDGSFLTFEGMALSLGEGEFSLRKHQADAIWRAVVNRRSINAHEVGTGKTFTMGGIAVESRRYGIAKKPIILAHNANSATVANEIRMMYPSARVLYVDNLDPKNREIRLRQIANDDWDAIVIPHSLIDRMALREETLMQMAADDIAALEAEFYDAAAEDGVDGSKVDLDDDESIGKIRSVTAKELAKARKRIIENIKKQAQQSSREGAVTFEDLGIDMVLVDEVHEFKKPPIVTRMQMKGLNTQVSARSIALQFMTRYVRQMNNGGNVHTFTGTPITNTITEIYHQMRYVMESEMEQANVSDWDGWFGSFATEVQDVELSAAGDYEMVTRLAGFVNVPELRQMVGQYMDTVFAEDMPEMQPRRTKSGKRLTDDLTEDERAELLNGRTENAQDRPYKRVINVSSDMTDEQQRVFSELQRYAQDWRSGTGKERREWMRKGDPRSPIVTEGIANKASFDVRLLDESLAGMEGKTQDSPNSKASRAVANVLEIYNSHPQAGQVIFADTGFSTSVSRSTAGADGERVSYTVKTFSTINDIVERLVQGGIPRAEIAVVTGSTNKQKRAEIAEAVNESRIRVVIGSTDTLGVGVNMQRNLRAMHHLDAPYMPGELEQRNGRGQRQRNQWNTVLEYRYMTDRLDGRRWQILAVKQRFINAFMKANTTTRVIEGEAAADEQSDILESFSEAAGDPRVLQRVKLQKKVESLQRKERLYTQGIADMRRQARSSGEEARRLDDQLSKIREANALESVAGLIKGQQERFTAEIDGQSYGTRKEAVDALAAYVAENIRVDTRDRKVGTYGGHDLMVGWRSFDAEPTTTIKAFGESFEGKGIAGAEARMRNYPTQVARLEARMTTAQATADNMTQAMGQPFGQAGDLAKTIKQLEDLEADLSINPVPPPAWLRQGAPIDSEVYHKGRPFAVVGHRYSKDGWFVIAEDEKGSTLIPYLEAADAAGMQLYEEREFAAPEVITKTEGQQEQAAAEGEEANFADSPAERPGTAQDKAVMRAIAEGKTARDVLRLIASSSKKPFNRQVARLLLKAGITPHIEFGHIGRRGADGILGQYRGKTDTIHMAGSAEHAAERIFLHEAMHAATMRALRRKGLHSIQLRKLFEHVSKQKSLAGFYGMKNVDEFVAEVFTNPDFQRALKAVNAPSGSPLKTAWDSFVRIMRSILGLGNDTHSALSHALSLGVGVVREDMLVRRRGGQVSGTANMAMDQTETEAFKRWFGDWQNAGNETATPNSSARGEVDAGAGADGVRALRGQENLDAAADRRDAVVRLAGGAATFDGASGPTGAGGAPLRLYHGTRDDIRSFDLNHPNRKDHGWLGDGVYLTSSDFVAEQYARLKRGEHGPNVMPVYANVRNPYVATRSEKNRIKLGGKAAARAFTERVRALGHDGVVLDLGDGVIELVALDSTQVKSATGNSGNFDPNDPDIANFGADDVARIKSSAMDQITQAMRHPGTVSLWDKTVGTMRNLAERNPLFKPVYEAAQRFIDDVAMLANDAADMAPRVLPRVDTWRDLGKKPIGAADNKAIGKPLFEGTLLWARDEQGKPTLVSDLQERYAQLSADDKSQKLLHMGKLDAGVLKMWRGLPVDQYEKLVNSRFESQALKPGVVWSGKELKALFGATDNQVSLYQEVRRAIDRSIDMTARTDMLRVLGKEFASMRELVLDQDSLQDAMELLIAELQERANASPDDRERMMGLHNQVVDRATMARELQDAGYMPLSRFGKYTVDVVGQDGERLYFGMYETKGDSNRAKLQLQAEFPQAKVTNGTMSQDEFKLFAGITPESLEMFGNMLGLDGDGNEARDQVFQKYIALTKNNHSAMKRLMHRKGIAGFSEDVGRVLASFVYSNARQAAGALNAGTLNEAVSNIPKEQGELKDVAMGLRNYIQDPQEEGQAVRGMLFAQYLGGSVASAFVNMTQPFAVTLPWLSQYGGITKAGAQLSRALKDMGTKGFQYEKDLTVALKQAEDDGIVSPQEIHQLMAQARGSGSLRSGDGTRTGDARAAASNAWERTKVAWGQPFALAEQFNRRSTFIAAYRIAKEQGMANPAEFARLAVEETQFVYSKANKMRWGRGAVGGALMTFKSYSIQYLELLNRMWTQGGPEGKRAVGWAMAALMLMGGAGGLPFMEDLEDLMDGIAQLMGLNISTKRKRQEFLRAFLGEGIAEFIEDGASGLPGAPIDVSGRLGLGDLIPGTGLLMSKQSRERDLLEVAGPAGDLIKRGFTGGRKLLSGNVAGAVMDVSPTAVRNAAKGIDMAISGMYKDTKGYKVVDTRLDEALAKAAGFQPRSVAEIQEANSFMMRSKSFYQQTSAEIRAQWADALFRKDDAAVERARARLERWNRDNPEQPIVIRMPDVWKRVREMGKDRTERIAATAPKALRQQMREMAAEAG